ncbi:coiled-coil domain-containing protein 172 isoform X1 [Clupea harengus]|uniref:Coiled-coil domain-containing protein 172 n=1 Tax=Clupea harengus TaxID=7950 RepID=A0A6P8GJN3_CLUHA|nr:coiled-coil domain-containing protein 172 isoform X1 [Clupea harengus]
MSLDTLFRHIILTEQHVSENCRQLLEAKSAIAKSHEQIKTHREQLNCLRKELDQKGHLVSEMILQCDLLKRQQEHLDNRSDQLQQEQQRLRDYLETMKTCEVEQQKTFRREVNAFNSEYSLLSHKHTTFYSQAIAEMLRLTQEADILSKEMQCMTQTNAHMNVTEEKKTVLQSHLAQLELQHGELDTEVKQAASLTDALKDERMAVTKKPIGNQLPFRFN